MTTDQRPSARVISRALRVQNDEIMTVEEQLVIEEPLEIRIVHGPATNRKIKPLSVTMRTPGHDSELAAGFLITEGIVRDADDIESIEAATADSALSAKGYGNTVVATLVPNVEVSSATLERNFYTTSSCGICGKASLLALQTVCPPRGTCEFVFDAEKIGSLPEKLRRSQEIFGLTGGLHGAALVSADGEIVLCREDVGRHNAVDKLIGRFVLRDELPLRNLALMLSGRVSFDLMQKAVMASIPMVIAIGAPSSLAVAIAQNFNLTLVGFLRPDHFNIYSGEERIRMGQIR